MALHAWSSAHYVIPLPVDHRFPIAKCALLRDAVLAESIVRRVHVHAPARVALEDVRRVHDKTYLERLMRGTLNTARVARGFL